MNREEIIRMRQQADRFADEICHGHLERTEDHMQRVSDERFATLVAAAEREACAKVGDEYSAIGKIEEFDRGWLACAKAMAAAIRARGQA